MKKLLRKLKKYWKIKIKKVRPRFKKTCRRVRTTIVKKVKFYAKVFNNILDRLIRVVFTLFKFWVIMTLINYTIDILKISSCPDKNLIWWIMFILSIDEKELDKLKYFLKRKDN